jgi:hypothetical protein
MTTEELANEIVWGMTLREKAAIVRKALKTQLGYGPKQVSCKICLKTEHPCIILGINDPQVSCDQLWEVIGKPFWLKVPRLRISRY